MNKITACLAGAATAASMLVTPTMATTDAGAYGQHQTDCLKLLFSDSAAHHAQCGGPFVVPSSVIPTSGFGSGGCEALLTTLTMPSRPVLLAGQGNPCTPPNNCGSLPNALPDDGLVPLWFERSRGYEGPTLLTGC